MTADQIIDAMAEKLYFFRHGTPKTWHAFNDLNVLSQQYLKGYALAARCETATGPDREIDAMIFCAVKGWAFERGNGGRAWLKDVAVSAVKDGRSLTLQLTSGEWSNEIGTVTASLDAITALIERELPGWLWLTGHSGDSFPGLYSGLLLPTGAGPDISCRAKTPALALCAAFCRAMAALEAK